MRFSFAASWVREIAKTPPALPLRWIKPAPAEAEADPVTEMRDIRSLRHEIVSTNVQSSVCIVPQRRTFKLALQCEISVRREAGGVFRSVCGTARRRRAEEGEQRGPAEDIDVGEKCGLAAVDVRR